MFLLSLLSLLAAGDERPFRIIDINVWSGTDYQGRLAFSMWESPSLLEQRYQILLANLKEADPDVIFIQETSPVDRYTRRLAKDLDMDQIHQVCIAGIKVLGAGPPWKFKEGNSILARKELNLTRWDDWKLSGSPGIYSDRLTIHFDETVSALVGRISIDGKPVYLISTHLNAAPRDEQALLDSLTSMRDSGEILNYEYEELYRRWQKGIRRRQTEMARLLGRIKRLPAGTPVIVGADFNEKPQSDVVRDFITRGRFVHLPITPDSLAVTWDAVNNTNTFWSQRFTDARGRKRDNWYKFNAIAAKLPRRLDYIFLNEKFAGTDSIRSTIVLDQPVDGVFASDHYGVQVDLDISKSLEGVPKLYGPLEIHKPSLSIMPVPAPSSGSMGLNLEFYLLSALKRNESFYLTLYGNTEGDMKCRLDVSLPDYDLRQRRKYGYAVDLRAEYRNKLKANYFGLWDTSEYKDREYYTLEEWEVRPSLSRSFSSHFIGQLGYRFRSVKMSGFKQGGLLENEFFPADTSTRQYSSLFENLRYDTRDSFYNPYRGLLLQQEVEPVTLYTPDPGKFITGLWDSKIKYTLNAQFYSVLFYPNTVLALRLLGQHISRNGGDDDLHLQSLLSLGGENTLRGSPAGRYLGNVMAVANAELRFPVYGKLGGILAWDTGKVWSELREASLSDWPGNPTAGLRLELPDIDILIKLELSNFLLRFDVGFGRESTCFHFNFGQAF
ncbi:MAG: BamA/TamA family outer membrane protein [Candidatus Syntrophosphaera sp.]|nr:BamA/TamA family outer membrane protein [Candidatus Syntrophosphaera sp.]